MFKVFVFVIVIIAAWLVCVILQALAHFIFNKIPYMCEQCGHTFTEGEDPAQRCPICDSY